MLLYRVSTWLVYDFSSYISVSMTSDLATTKIIKLVLFSFWFKIVSEQYIWLQPSIFSTIKDFVKNVIYWVQAEKFWSIRLGFRAISIKVVFWRFELKTWKSDFGKTTILLQNAVIWKRIELVISAWSWMEHFWS